MKTSDFQYFLERAFVGLKAEFRDKSVDPLFHESQQDVWQGFGPIKPPLSVESIEWAEIDLSAVQESGVPDGTD